MATTTNYSWSTPDDTALVKDGAAAIRTLGSSVDTTVKALNPETTLGDIAYRSSTANVKTRLGLGTAGQVLTVNSGATAPEWTTISAGSMTLISTTTLTGASITLSSIPQTYNSLRLICQNFKPATDGQQGRMRINADTATRYRSITAFSGIQSTYNSTFIDNVFAPNDNSVASGLSIMDIPDYTNAITWKMVESRSLSTDSASTADLNFNLVYGVYNQTTAITSLTFFPSSGNFTSGTLLLYGVK
jgi:hypothetical protein